MHGASQPIPEKKGKAGGRIPALLGRIFLWLMLVVFFLAAGLIIFNRTILKAYAPQILGSIKTQYHEQYGLDLAWQSYAISGVSDYAIKDITVTDIVTGRTFLTSESLRVRTNFLTIAGRRLDPNMGVTYLEFEHPVITLWRIDGKWNTGKLFEAPTKPQKKFQGRLAIVIRDGNIVWEGGEMVPGHNVQAMEITDFKGEMSQEPGGAFGLTIDGIIKGSGTGPSPLSAKLTYKPSDLLYEITGTIGSLDLSLAAPYVEQYDIYNLKGKADIEVSLLIGPKAGASGLSLLGKAAIQDGSLHYSRYNFDAVGLYGDLHFSHKSLFTAGLTGSIENSPTTIKGRIGDFGDVSYNFIIDSASVNPPLAQKIVPSLKKIPLDGPVNAHVEALGKDGDWKVIVQADSPNVSYYKIPLKLNNLLAWYENDYVTFQRIEASALSGSIVATGAVNSRNPETTYQFHMSGSGIPVQQFASMLPSGTDRAYVPSGNVSGDITLTGTGSGSPKIQGIVFVPAATIPAIPALPALTVTAPISGTASKISVRGASITGKGVAVLVDAEVVPGGNSTGSIALTVDNPGMLGRMTNSQITGSLALGGNLSYKKQTGLIFNGDAVLSDLSSGTVIAGPLSSKINYSNGILKLSDFGGFFAGARLSGNLTFPLAGKENAQGTFTLAGLNISPFLPTDLQPLVATTLSFDGNIGYISNDTVNRDLVLNLVAAEAGARVGPDLVSTSPDGIKVQITISSNFSEIKNITVLGTIKSKPANAPVYAGRTLSPYSSRLVREVTDLLSGKSVVTVSPPSSLIPAISGTLDINADLVSPLNQIRGGLNLNASNLVVEGFPFTEGWGYFNSDDGVKWTIDLGASSGDAGSVQVAGSVDRAANISESQVNLEAVVRNSGLNQLFKVFGLDRYGQFSGTMNGSGAITGTIGTPEVAAFQLNLGPSHLFGVPLTQGTANFSYRAPMFNLESLELLGDNGLRALGAGSIDMTAPSLASANLVLRIDKLNLEFIHASLGTKFPLGGIASGTVQLARDGLGTMVLYNATVDGAAYRADGDSLSLGTVTLDAITRPGNPVMTINSFHMARESQTITVAGTMPVNLSNFSTSVLPYFDLSIVSDTGYDIPIPAGLLAAGVSMDGGLGPVHLTLKGAELAGDIGVNVRNMRLGEITVFNSLEGTFHAENSIIKASPDEVRINGGTGASAWQLGVSGQANFMTMVLGIPGSVRFAIVPVTPGPVRLAGTGYDLVLQPGSGNQAPAFEIRGKFPKLTAIITGSIVVTSGTLNTAAIPPIPVGKAETSSPLTFDLDMNLQGNLIVHRGDTFNFTFESGTLTLTGSGSKPSLVGRLTAPSGWMDILGNHFVLTEPLGLEFSSFYQFDPHVTAAAQATLRDVQSPQNLGEDLVITARFDSRLSKMLDNIQLTSQPPLSKSQILASLAYQNAVFRTLGQSLTGETQMGSLLSQASIEGVALPIASSYLARYIRREAGFSDFTIDVGPDQDIRVYLEKPLFDHVSGYYQQVLGSNNKFHLIGLRYQFRSRSFVGVEYNSDSGFGAKIQYIIPLGSSPRETVTSTVQTEVLPTPSN